VLATWWVDSVTSLAIVWLLVKEGWEALKEDYCSEWVQRRFVDAHSHGSAYAIWPRVCAATSVIAAVANANRAAATAHVGYWHSPGVPGSPRHFRWWRLTGGGMAITRSS